MDAGSAQQRRASAAGARAVWMPRRWTGSQRGRRLRVAVFVAVALVLLAIIICCIKI